MAYSSFVDYRQRDDSLSSSRGSHLRHRGTMDYYNDAAEEFFKTEETYRNSLLVLQKAYLEPFMNEVEEKPAAHEALSIYFGDVMNIIGAHTILYRRILEVIPSFVGTPDGSHMHSSVGTASANLDSFPTLLLEMTSQFELAYTNYILHYDAHEQALKLVERELSENTWVCCRTIVDGLVQVTPCLAGVDLSFIALKTIPLKRLTNYALLTQEWISQLRKSNLEVPPLAEKGQESITQLLQRVERCNQMLISSRRLRELERRYNLPDVSRDTEVKREGSWIKATRLKPGEQNFKLRPGYVIFTDINLYVVKLDAPEGKSRSVVKIPLTTIRGVRTVGRGLLSQQFEHNAALMVEFIDEAGSLNETPPPQPQGQVVSPLSAPSSPDSCARMVEAVEVTHKQVYLLSPDELEVNSWKTALTETVDRLLSGR